MNKTVSYYENLTDVSSNKMLEGILNQIKSGEVKNEVNKIRTLIAEGGDVTVLKKKLPSFTVTGTFKDKRKSDNIETYSSLLVLDYDKLTKAQIEFLSKELPKQNCVYSYFISPSGKGLKVIVLVDTGVEQHGKDFCKCLLCLTNYLKSRLIVLVKTLPGYALCPTIQKFTLIQMCMHLRCN